MRTPMILAALCLSGVFAAWLFGAPLPWAVVQPDTGSYWDIAANLADSGRFSLDGVAPTARRELLYPLFLAGFIKAGLVPGVLDSARQAWPVILVQCVFYLAGLRLLAGALRTGWNDRIAGIALVAGAAFPPLFQYAFQLVSEGLLFVLLAAALAALERWSRGRSALAAASVAVLLGAMALLKAVMLLFPLLLLAYSARSSRLRFAPTLAVVLVALALAGSWTVRNALVLDTLVVSTTDGGSSFYRGNMATWVSPPSLSDPAIPAEVREHVAGLDAREADAYYASLAKAFLAASPLRAGVHFAYKLFVLLIGLPISTAHAALMAVRALFWIVLLSRIVPLWRGAGVAGRTALLLTGYLAVVYTVIYATPRYMAPGMFVLMPFCVAALDQWRTRLARRG